MILERRATETVLDGLEWAPVVLVEGPRQAGKSVLVRDLVGAQQGGSRSYITLDDALVLASALEDPQGFILGLPDPVILDEVQRAPGIFLPVKLTVDRDRRAGHFLLTGSANVLLLPQMSDSLAGRMRIVTLWPLSQGEIDGVREQFLGAAFGDAGFDLVGDSISREERAERIVRGGFPEAVGLPAGSARDGWMRSYVTTLLERDVRDLSDVADRVGLPRLLRVLAARSGTLLNVSDLGRATGVARATLDRYLATFQKVFAVSMVPAWSGDVARRLVKSPKVLFCDSGLAANLIGVGSEALLANPDGMGALLETFVGAELQKQMSFAPDELQLMHYRDASGNEVDWVLEDRRGRLVGIEVKATQSPSSRDLKGMRAFADSVGDRFHRGFLLHSGTAMAPLGDNIWAVPVDALWRLRAREG